MWPTDVYSSHHITKFRKYFKIIHLCSCIHYQQETHSRYIVLLCQLGKMNSKDLRITGITVRKSLFGLPGVLGSMVKQFLGMEKEEHSDIAFLLHQVNFC